MTIKQIQHLLAYLGYYKLDVDGQWGCFSESACMSFQQDYNKRPGESLDVDGVAGKATQEALRKAVGDGMTRPSEKPDAGTSNSGDWPDCPNFTRAEFACRCGCGFDDVDHDLVRICQRLRDHFGSAFIISSGPRCRAHNAAVGGVATSKHLTGRAVDFCIKGRRAKDVQPIAQVQPGIRYSYCIDDSYVHMEMP